MMEKLNTSSNPQREKTEGEKRFDWMVYGGIGWVLNATISAVATYSLYRVKSIRAGFEQHIVDPIVKLKPFGLGEKAIKDGIFGTTLCSGGTLLVPVMKHYEDQKSEIVQKWDEEIYGKDHVAHDPKLIQAHQDMENAPKQSWLSMWGARAAVIGIAFGMGKTIGSHDSWLGKFSDKYLEPVKGIASFERIGASATRTTMKISNWITHDVFKMKTTPLMDAASAKASPVKILDTESNALHAGEIVGYELAQSSTIALIFYGLSKAISGIFHRPEANPRHIPTTVTFDAGARRRKEAPEPAEKAQPAPENTVSDVAHEAKIGQEKPKDGPLVAA